MTKKHFIALADAIREHNRLAELRVHTNMNGAHMKPFTSTQLSTLADFLKQQNPRFNHDRWLAYIAGECGPNGGRK